MIKSRLQDAIVSTLKKLGVKTPYVEISHPVHTSHGDFSTNAAFKYAKQLNKHPLELANEITKFILKDSIDLLEEVRIEKPGFINFFIKPQIFFEDLQTIKILKKNKVNVLVEYGDANTHKVPHVGHLFSYIYGESLARILERQGHTIKRLSYQGDIGLHVAKCLYVARNKIQEAKNKPLQEKVNFLQECYQEGTRAYDKTKKTEHDIDVLNQKIYAHENDITKLWEETRLWSLEFYKQFEKKLGIRYDKYYFESKTGPLGKKLASKHIGKIFEESKGAVIFKGEKYGLHTRVFINKNGNPTYEAKDIGLITQKKRDFPFDLSIVTTASEQNEYWKVVIKTSELLYPELSGKLKHLGFGMISLSSGKMSSRKGTIVDAFNLVSEITNKIHKKYKTDVDLSEKIALAAIKYSFLRSDAYKNITFDVEKSIAREGDSGPYLLYTYVRIQSVLAKSESTKTSIPSSISEEEKNLLKHLIRFSDVAQKASELYSPHLIAHYLYELAQTFNVFYQRHPILKAPGDLSHFRLALTKQVGSVIKTGLTLLGIETIEKM